MIILHSHLRSCRPKIPVIILSCVVYLYFCCPALARSNVTNVNSIIQCPDREREALLQFKHGIKNDYCGLLTSWGRNADCCQWRGVLCSNHTGHVITIRLVEKAYHSDCLDGKVSPSLGELKHLTHLNLSFNDFSQPIPSFLGSLENLELLSLSYSFKGDIPHQLGNLTKLKTLELASDIYLYVNSLQKLQWLSRLTLLRYLDLSGVDLSKATNWMQIVSSLPFLSVLNLQSCGLSAKIPSSLTYINSSTTLGSINLAANIFNDTSIYQWLFNLPGINTQLVHLDLSMNELQGPIPNGLGNMQHLSHLDLSFNHLEGPILSEFQNMHSLTYLALSANSFRGSVFKIFSKLCNLERLYLGSNSFIDELTDVIKALNSCRNKALLSLELSQNRFWGTIPDSISSLSSLEELYLDGNQLTGNITESISQLARLEKLDLSSNFLEGALTHRHFINLSRLRELYLSDNSILVLDIDPSWDPPFQLDIISLRSCKLGPYFPKWLQMQTNFSYLDEEQLQWKLSP